MTASAERRVRKRILIADDELALGRSLARVLTNAGYEVVTVGDGEAAVEAIGTQHFDVVLSDIQMPGMTGVDLLREIRVHDLDVPVVLMTADPTIETAALAVELGALQYLLKPISVEVLLQGMERATKLSQMARIKRQAMELLGALEPQAGDRAGLMASFDRCLGSMWMAFQPIVRSESGAGVYGYEALLRSREPSLPHPGAVLEAAERLDRLPELGRKLRALAAETFASRNDDALLFFNLHTRDLLDPDLSDPAAPLSRIAPRVILEITERSAIDDVKDIRTRVAALRAMGFRIAVDDLGAGYAGLTSFALLEPEIVKLDMSLVRGVHASPVKAKIIGSMTGLCKDMGLLVVAEGIETVEERETLASLGCDLMQGYLFARPGPPFPMAVWP